MSVGQISNGFRVLHVSLLLVAAVVLCCGQAAAQGRDFGRTTVRVPAPTTDGDWAGTWIFGNRDRRIAVWLRISDGRPEMRVKLIAQGNAESFTTDWSGRASYAFRGVEGDAAILIDEADADRMTGSWRWRSARGQQARTETGTFSLHRADDGRYLVFDFDAFEVERRDGDRVMRMSPRTVWSFRKASRRLAEWDELAF